MSDTLEVEPWGWSAYFTKVISFFEGMERQYDASPNRNYTEYVMETLGVLWRNLSIIKEHIESAISEESQFAGASQSLLRNLDNLLGLLPPLAEQWHQRLEEIATQFTHTRYLVPSLNSGQRGRPVFHISKEQLEYLHSLSFSWTDIGKILGVSRMTIYRRRVEYEMLSEPTQIVSDSTLYELVEDLRRELPDIGHSMVCGRLRSLGIKVNRERIREAVRRTDPLNTALRWNTVTQRIPYTVSGPNSLWHLDGHHKLIRWRFVTHGGIDGYSRLIVFLKCSSNNKADTVLRVFDNATKQYGIPSRIRTDHGGENISTALFMLRSRGTNRRSVITGSSTHNQRIERLWRDMHRSVTVLYYRLFYFLEEQQLLDPINEIHLFCLQYIYLPRINRALQIFSEGWNCHQIRTANHRSPQQLFLEGALRFHRSGLAAVDFFQDVEDLYGIDYEEIPISSDNDRSVIVPQPNIAMSDLVIQQLRERVNPMDTSSNYGIELYETAVEIVNSVLNQ